MALGARLADSAVHYLDAPISGSSEQARRGEAILFVGGDPKTFETCSDLWAAVGSKTLYVGAYGNAAKMKLISNLVVGLNRVALAEGLAFAEAVGVPLVAAHIRKAVSCSDDPLRTKALTIISDSQSNVGVSHAEVQVQ